MVVIIIITGVIVCICFICNTYSKKRGIKPDKGIKLNKDVMVKHRGQLKRYRINKYGELYEK